MKALAIVRSSVSENIEEQRLRITAYAQSENINVVHVDIRVDEDFGNIKHSLEIVDIVIVTELTRITNDSDKMNEFKELLSNYRVKLVSLLE
jgi:DNA invertase Pin-like site-specific DNA recombinase